MIKRVQDLTKEDKDRYYNAVKEEIEKSGVPWKEMEKRIQDDIDQTFDDEAFLKMDPDFQIDAVLCRKEFGKNKPSIIDYLLWSGKVVTKSDYVEIPDTH